MIALAALKLITNDEHPYLGASLKKGGYSALSPRCSSCTLFARWFGEHSSPLLIVLINKHHLDWNVLECSLFFVSFIFSLGNCISTLAIIP